jgi:UDP-N-acetylmuramoyl-tripeptide--D-alanyl-D-alanine ligase
MSTTWTAGEVRAALGVAGSRAGAPVAPELEFSGVVTDTRALPEGTLFVALRGEHFDAHDFLAAAAEAGALGAVVERVPEGAPELVYFRVKDTLAALGRLALHRRRRLGAEGAQVVAITGTNGKTTTKDMVAAVLRTRYRVHATSGNLNNQVGAPLTLLTAPAGVEALVVEVGTNAPGEIAALRDIVEPDAAIITGVAAGHLEGLGSVAGVLAEKTSLLAGLAEDAVAVVAEEPESLPRRARELARQVRVAGFGAGADADLRGEAVELDEEARVAFRWRGRRIRLAAIGRHNARNALLALGLGESWGIEPAAAAAALEALPPSKLRSEVQRIGGLVVIADCYNANPASMEAAIDLLAAMPRRGGRVAVVGTMKELGAESASLHRQAAATLAAAGLDLIVATGEFVAACAELADELGDRLIAAEDPLVAYERLAPRLRGDEVVLLKGSRGVALERLLPRLGATMAKQGGAGGGAARPGA